ncbi:MAG: 3-dehydroquinate synthase family protein [Thermaurantimonas sp.]
MQERSIYDSLILSASDGYSSLKKHIESDTFSDVFLLMDSNTVEFCRDDFFYKLNPDRPIQEIEVEPGESCKDIDVVKHLWSELAECRASRKSLLINLGGGSVCDLGGFVASTYMRGISYINVPTTLLAMIDAAYGGKTAIDFSGVKNLIGTFYAPEMILLDTEYTATLEERHFVGAFGEIFKYGLILDNGLWAELKEKFPDGIDFHLEKWVERCLQLKRSIVAKDPLDNGLRRILNAGHTIGHALEAFHLDKQDELYHGEAIAWGLIAELFIAHRLRGFDHVELELFKKIVQKHIQRPSVSQDDTDILLEYIYLDKKTVNSSVFMPIVESPGVCIPQLEVAPELVSEALIYMLT